MRTASEQRTAKAPDRMETLGHTSWFFEVVVLRALLKGATVS